MIVRSLADAEKSDRRVVTPLWESTRLVLKNDRMGYSVHVTTIYAGSEIEMEYRNHLETVYCIEGEGSVEDLATGEVHEIREGIVYVLDKNDRHILRARTPMRMVCVFNPPLNGKEVHDSNGVYPLEAEEINA